MDRQKHKRKQRIKRHWRIRSKFTGRGDRVRLAVHRSNKNISCQVIDDDRGLTLASASTLEQGVRSEVPYGGNCDAAARVGKLIAERAQAAGVRRVAFDRGGYKYHGRVKSLAEAAREAGLDF
jgi:large subunit ribosomal protein L18